MVRNPLISDDPDIYRKGTLHKGLFLLLCMIQNSSYFNAASRSAILAKIVGTLV